MFLYTPSKELTAFSGGIESLSSKACVSSLAGETLTSHRDAVAVKFSSSGTSQYGSSQTCDLFDNCQPCGLIPDHFGGLTERQRAMRHLRDVTGSGP